MAIVTTALVNLIVIVLIGIIVGLLFNRYGRSWLGRQVADSTGVGDVTYSLVGISGSFIGFHLCVILGLLPTPLMLYVAAIVGAVVTVWLWRGRRSWTPSIDVCFASRMGASDRIRRPDLLEDNL